MNFARSTAAVLSAVLFAILSSTATADRVSIDLVPIRNPGSPGEWSGASYGGRGPDRICGAVAYPFEIGKFEVTSGQYTQFLNEVADTDTHGLYDERMWSVASGCGIQRTGTSGNHIYTVAQDQADRPVNYIAFWDACRFANWLHNGQLRGGQTAATTEDGSYTLNGYDGSDGSWISRNVDATWVVPSEDEWYKAAYHLNDGITGHYFDYPTGTDSLPSNDLVDPDPGNNATFYDGEWPAPAGYTIGQPFYRTKVGAHEHSESPYGTYDQGGNVWEWNDSLIAGAHRGARGASFLDDAEGLHAAFRDDHDPGHEADFNGFRVALIPEPTIATLLLIGGILCWRRRAAHA